MRILTMLALLASFTFAQDPWVMGKFALGSEADNFMFLEESYDATNGITLSGTVVINGIAQTMPHIDPVAPTPPPPPGGCFVPRDYWIMMEFGGDVYEVRVHVPCPWAPPPTLPLGGSTTDPGGYEELFGPLW